MHLLTQQAEVLGPIEAEGEDFTKVSDDEFASMRQAAGRNYADVYVLQQLLKNLDQEYMEVLKQK